MKGRIRKYGRLIKTTRYKCKGCKKDFLGSISIKRQYCSRKCYWKSLIGKHQSIETIQKKKQYCLNKSFSWKGGRTKDSRGYILIKLPSHPFAKSSGYIYEHRVVVETKIRRYLKSAEHIHHKNGIKGDNRIDNLTILSNAEHKRLHCRDSKNRKLLFS